MSKLTRAFEQYNSQHFEGIDVLSVPQRWRVMSNIRYKDLKARVRGPEATVHVCSGCGSTGFQIHEVRPPRSKAVSKKLVASCLECGKWYNFDKYTYR